jgi:spore coat polysaccharide biosynthesis protein SpsF
MNTGIIVQARMTSRRLPGKVLHVVAGKPLLQYLLERIRARMSSQKIVVATSSDPSDQPVSDLCGGLGVDCYRGPLENVAARLQEVVEAYSFDSFVRISGDSPLLDAHLIARGLNTFREGDFDLVTNVLPRTFPKGQSVEIVRSDTFKKNFRLIESSEDQEHVTTYFYKNKDRFRIFNFESGGSYADIQLAIDTPQDVEIFTAIIQAMNRPHWEYSLEELLPLYHQAARPIAGSLNNHP